MLRQDFALHMSIGVGNCGAGESVMSNLGDDLVEAMVTSQMVYDPNLGLLWRQMVRC